MRRDALPLASRPKSPGSRVRDYLRRYDAFSPAAPFIFLRDAVFASSNLQRLSLVNRSRDYLGLAGRPQLLTLHREINRWLAEASEGWDGYDYGEGYFYQSFAPLGISGLRDTAARVETMDLRRLALGRHVIDIGCNAGFLALTVAQVATRVVGVDANPFLVGIAQSAARHLGSTNTQFDAVEFETVRSTGEFDLVLSLANHSTYDGRTRHSLPAYFDRCRDLLRSGGLLVFESHPPAHEGKGLDAVCALIAERFAVRSRSVHAHGTFLDRDRTRVIAEKR